MGLSPERNTMSNVKAQFLAQVEATRQLGKDLLIEFTEPVYREEFYGLNLSDMGLVRINFIGCTFEDCDFSHTLIMSSAFRSCIFKRCTFERAIFHSAKFASCDLTNCQFERTSICGTMIENVFTKCSFVDADYIGSTEGITDRFIHCQGVIDMGADSSGVRYIALRSNYEVIGGYSITWGSHACMRSELSDKMKKGAERWLLPFDSSIDSRYEYDMRCADFWMRVKATDEIAALYGWKVW